MALPPKLESTSTSTTTSTSTSTPTLPSTTPLSTSPSSTPSSTLTSLTSSSTPSISIVTITSTSSSSSSPSSSATVSTSTTKPLPLPTTTVPESTSTFTVSLPTDTPTISAASRASNKGFFSNKGAVAGVFTVAGLIGLVLIIVMVTNFVRRRRAKQFDKDTAEAAMAAIAASRRQNFDDYEYPGRGLSGAGYGEFSADTHGAYAQPALASGRDAYMMHNVNAGGGGYGARDEYAGVAGAAGIGAAVGAVAMQRARSRRSAGLHGQEDYGNAYDQTPYPAFSGPGAHPLQHMHDQPQSQGPRYQHDMMESTVLGGAVGAFVNRRPSQQPLAQTVDLARNKSQGSPGPNDEGPIGSPPQDESYASHYQTVGYSDVPKDPFRRNTLRPPPASANPHDVAYGGYDEPHHHTQGSDDERESAESVREDDDYAQPRVLKVANADSD